MKEYRIEHKSAAMHVVDAVRNSIRNGDLKEGDKLPNETEMAKELGVGRSSIRESMRILKAYGVVDVRQGEGTYITNRCAEQVFEILGFFPNDDMTMEYLVNLRQVIEPSNLKLNYDKVTDAQISELCELTGYIKTTEATEKRIWADAQFHKSLINASGNPLLAEVYSMLTKMQKNLMNRLMCYDNVVEDAYISHYEIIEGLKKKNGAACAAAMEQHLVNVKNYFDRYYTSLRIK